MSAWNNAFSIFIVVRLTYDVILMCISISHNPPIRIAIITNTQYPITNHNPVAISVTEIYNNQHHPITN